MYTHMLFLYPRLPISSTTLAVKLHDAVASGCISRRLIYPGESRNHRDSLGASTPKAKLVRERDNYTAYRVYIYSQEPHTFSLLAVSAQGREHIKRVCTHRISRIECAAFPLKRHTRARYLSRTNRPCSLFVRIWSSLALIKFTWRQRYVLHACKREIARARMYDRGEWEREYESFFCIHTTYAVWTLDTPAIAAVLTFLFSTGFFSACPAQIVCPQATILQLWCMRCVVSMIFSSLCELPGLPFSSEINYTFCYFNVLVSGDYRIEG